MFEKEELIRFLRGKKEISGIPCGFWMHFPEGQKWGQASVEVHKEYYQRTHVPLMKMMNEHPLVINYTINRPEDWSKVDLSNIDDGIYREYLDEIRAFRKQMGNNALILATIHGVLVSACHATDGMGKFPNMHNTITQHLKESPEPVSIGLWQIGKILRELSFACLEAGADGIYYAALGGEEERFSEKLYTTYVKPIETWILNSLMDKGIVILHICKENPRLTMYQDYPCHVVNWAEHSSHYTLKDGIDMFPNQKIIGGFNNKCGVLIEGDEKRCFEQIIKVVEEIGKQRLIIGADCTLPETIDQDKLRAIVEFCGRIE